MTVLIPPVQRLNFNMAELVYALVHHPHITLGELASLLGRPVEGVRADVAGLHDTGYLTMYGSKPTSIVAWGGITDGYVDGLLRDLAAYRAGRYVGVAA